MKLLSFNAWSKERISQGRKHITSRTSTCPSDPRVSYITPLLPWWFIREFLWRDEGADSPEELQQVIDDIFRRKVEDNELFYVHVLRSKDD